MGAVMIRDVTIRTPCGECCVRITDEDTVESVIAWAKRATGCLDDEVEELETIEAVGAAARRGPIDLVMTGGGV